MEHGTLAFIDKMEMIKLTRTMVVGAMELPLPYGRHIAILVICSAPFCFSCADSPILWLNNTNHIAETRTVACVARLLRARDTFSKCGGSNPLCAAFMIPISQ